MEKFEAVPETPIQTELNTIRKVIEHMGHTIHMITTPTESQAKVQVLKDFGGAMDKSELQEILTELDENLNDCEKKVITAENGAAHILIRKISSQTE